MVLSTGTLNLKFMQRAAARQGPSTPTSTPSAPITREGQTQSNASPKEKVGTRGEGRDLSAIELMAKNEQWVLPRSSIAKRPTDQWNFEKSFMGFISHSSGSRGGSSAMNRGTHGGDVQVGLKSGGGRMTFGFGEDKGGEREEGEGEDDDDDNDVEDVDEDEVDAKKTASTSIPRPVADSFLRPKGFSPPRTEPTEKGSKRSTDSTKAKASSPHTPTSSSTSQKSHGDKKPKRQIHTDQSDRNKKQKMDNKPFPHPVQLESTESKDTKPDRAIKGFKGPERGLLDDRERALKAQKKKDKRAKKL